MIPKAKFSIMTTQPTLRLLLNIQPTQKQLESNRHGILTAGQLDYVVEKYRQFQTAKRDLDFILIVEIGLMLFVTYGALNSNHFPFAMIGIMLVITFFMIATSYFRHQKRRELLALQADIEKPSAISITGIPSIEFEEGKAYVEIAGVRWPARDKYAVGYKTDKVYTVYCTPNAHIPFSYERVTDQSENYRTTDDLTDSHDNTNQQMQNVKRKR